MIKQEWLIERVRILTGTLTEADLERFYTVFHDKCIAHYRTIDFETFKGNFGRWFNNPISIVNGLPSVTSQNTIVHNMIRYYDLLYNVTYLYDSSQNFIKAY